MAWISTEVDVDIDEHLDYASTKYLKKELVKRGYVFSEKYNHSEKNKLKEKLCDIVGVNYHTDNDTLLNLINEIL